MAERDLLGREISAIVYNKVNIFIAKSNKYEDIDLFYGKVESKYIMVVINRENKVLVTARKMRKKEKIMYEEEIAKWAEA